MITQKGWQDQVMMSLFTKEAAYDAGVTMNATNACGMKGFECDVEWSDTVTDDKDSVSGTEHGTDQEITAQGVDITYKESRCKPNTLAAFSNLVLGARTSTQDGAFTAYKHKITPVAVGTVLPSIQIEHKKGAVQYAYKGVKGGSLNLSGEAGGYLALEAALKGSGTRATSATAFVAAIAESWLKVSNCKVWMETGANIAIGATLGQGTEDISSATPDDLKVRLKSFNVGWDNGLEGQAGFGGAGVFQDIDYGRRKCELSFSLLFYDATELAYFTAQDPCAIEFDLKGALIAAGGAMYYGAQIVVPRFKIKKAPLPKGGAGDILTCDFECDVQDDGTNAPLIIEAYTAKAAYLA
jgi:hypothetical protein